MGSLRSVSTLKRTFCSSLNFSMGSTDVKLISLNTLGSFSHSHHHNSHWHLCIFSLHHHYSTLHIVIVNKMEKNQRLLAFFNTLWSYHIGNTNNQSITKLSSHNLSTTIPIITVKISVKITFSTTTIMTNHFHLDCHKQYPPPGDCSTFENLFRHSSLMLCLRYR